MRSTEIRILADEEMARFRGLYRVLASESPYLLHEPDERISTHGLIFVAETEGEWIGFLTFSRGSARKSSHRGELSMAVKRSHWRNGVGRALLRALESWALSTQVWRLELSVLATNQTAIQFYEADGFVQEGFKVNALLVGESFLDGIFMAKWIGPSQPFVTRKSRRPQDPGDKTPEALHKARGGAFS